MDEELEKRIFPNRRFDHLTLEGQKLENKRMGLIGIKFRNLPIDRSVVWNINLYRFWNAYFCIIFV